MRTLNRTNLATMVAAAGVAMLSAPAMAMSTWNASSCSQSGSSYTGCSAGSGLPTANASAYSTTGSSGTAFAAATLVSYTGGFGVTAAGETTTSPEHSMDNKTNTDAILLSFTSSVILKQLTIGWAAYDSDFTLLRYTGSTAPTVSGSISSLLGSGWSVVGNYMNTVASPAQNNNGATVTAVATVNSGGLASSWWLVSAYNSSYGGSVIGGTADSTADYIKLLSVAGDKQTTTTTGVPEPRSIALVAAALGGLWVSRRRLTKIAKSATPRALPMSAAA